MFYDLNLWRYDIKLFGYFFSDPDLLLPAGALLLLIWYIMKGFHPGKVVRQRLAAPSAPLMRRHFYFFL